MVRLLEKKMQAREMKNETPIQKVRNIGILAHIDAGKTTLTERILYYTGKIHRMGEVHEGTTTMDWMEQERERGVTITSAATTCHWAGHRINLIDTPGHVDFTAEVERSLRILDGAIVVFSGVEGVEAQSETVWHQADRYRVPRIVFINKMDRGGADFDATIEEIEKKLKAHPLILQLPIGIGDNFSGVIDLVDSREFIYEEEDLGIKYKIQEISVENREKAHKQREILIEKLSEVDDEIFERFIHAQPIDKELLKSAIRKATIYRNMIPVFCGSVLKNKVVQPLLDGVVEYLPSPIDIPPVKGKNPISGKEEERKASEGAPFTALAFKIVSDSFLGRLTYLRIYSGKIKTGERVYNPRKKKTEKIQRIFLMHANKREEIKEVFVGEIVAVGGLQFTVTGDTLCEEDHPILLDEVRFPEPVISVSIEPKNKEEGEKLQEVLRKLEEEDPTFKVFQDKETGQTIISGMGEFHLLVITHRIVEDFKVKAHIGKPQVTYRETIASIAEEEGKFIRQSGGKGNYGHVIIRLEPLPIGEKIEGTEKNFEFINKMKGGKIPLQFIPAIEEGIREAMGNGILAGYPVMSVKATLIDGSYHEVDSSEIAFRIASSIAFKEAMKKANPYLLEPVMRTEVVSPQEYLGEILAGLNGRRAEVSEVKHRGTFVIITAFVPLSEMFGYATALRSLTRGRGSYIMEFFRYGKIPEKKEKEILA